MTTPIYTTLPDFFHRYDPPQLSPPSPQAGRGSTRQPNATTHDVFESLNDRSLHVTHDATILPSLSTLLDSSWSEAAKTSPIGYLYDGFLEMTKHYLENTVIENEYNDLSSIFIHHLFALPNLVASRHKSLLIQEAYPAQTMKSSWSKSVSRVDHFADHYATLAPINTGVPRRASDRIPVEKKLPWKVGMQSIMGGLEAAAAGEGVETGFKIRLNEMADGVAQYLIPDNALLDSVFIDALMQTLEYMDTSKCGVGVLTSYDAYIVILRLTNNHITLSSPVIRSTINRDSLDDPFRNEMSLFDLLLALLLFVAQPKRLEEKSSLWTGLYVRTEEAERPTHTKRKNKEAGSTSKRSKQAGAGEGQGANERGEGGEQDQLDVETPIKHPHPSLLKHGNGPRRSDESTTSSLSSGTTSAAESILTPTSATFNLSSTSNPSLGPVIRFKFDDISTDWSLSVTDVDYFQRTTFHAVIPSDAEIGRLGMDGEGEVQILMEKMLGDGEYFLTFSSSASTPTYEDEEDREVDIVYPDSSPPQLDLSQTHFNPHKAKHHAAQHQRLILKFGYLQNRPHHPTGNEIALAIQNEVQTLSGPLSDLQGTVVPRLFGLWRSKDWDWAVVVLEDVIEGFGREELRMDRGLTEGESAQIRSAYADLHTRHVIHNDVEPRHILLSKSSSKTDTGTDAGVKIIDYDRAKVMDGEEEVECERVEVERLIRRCGVGLV